MSILRKPTNCEKKEILDLLPYGFVPYLKSIEMIDVSPSIQKKYTEYTKKNSGKERLLFHGSRKYHEILKSGFLDPCCTPRGKFSDGDGIYLAEDVDLSIPFGRTKSKESKIFIVKSFLCSDEVSYSSGKRHNKQTVKGNSIKATAFFTMTA